MSWRDAEGGNAVAALRGTSRMRFDTRLSHHVIGLNADPDEDGVNDAAAATFVSPNAGHPRSVTYCVFYDDPAAASLGNRDDSGFLVSIDHPILVRGVRVSKDGHPGERSTIPAAPGAID